MALTLSCRADPAPAVPPAPAPPATPPTPTFEASSHPLTEREKDAMRGTTWHPGCPLPLEALAHLELSHYGLDGEVHHGALVIDAAETEALTEVFRALFDARFPIASIEPIVAFGGDDDASMAANNSSAFNCRAAVGTTRFSEHAFGRAIDLNPLQNPYVKGAQVLPPGGRAHLGRDAGTPGLIRAGDATVKAFADRGWHWGGKWRSLKDYQHFSRSGR